MFLKNSRPPTKRQKTWLYGFWALGAAIAAVIVSYEVWAQTSIFKITDIRIQWVSVISLPCSTEHFWGQSIVYKRLTDDYERYGVLCRDWSKGQWILMDSRTRLY